MKKQQPQKKQEIKPFIRISHPSTSALCSIILIATVYVLTLCILQKRGFWIGDNAAKFLQVQTVINSNYSDYSLPWPGKVLDPDFAYNPLPFGAGFLQETTNKLFCMYSPVFPTVSSFFFRFFGFWGLYFLPLLSSVLMLAGLAKIAKTISPKASAQHPTVIIAGLCTPIWFYSVVFWEHALAVCLCVWGVYFYLQFLKAKSYKHLLIGSILAAFSIYFRDELYLFCLALVGVTFFYTPGRRLKTALLATFSMLIGILPLWLFQWAAIGQPLGFHLSARILSFPGILKHLTERPQVLYNLYAISSPNIWLSLAIAAPFIITFLLNPKLSKRAFIFSVPLYCLAALVNSLLVLKGYFSTTAPSPGCCTQTACLPLHRFSYWPS